MSDNRDSNKLSDFGLKATKLYLIVLVSGIPIAGYFSIIEFHQLKLNEIGDFLAGAFGPLAIFWLVLGFFQQGKELRNSADALDVQTKELKATVKAQNLMAKSAGASLELQEHQKHQENWLEARKTELDVRNALQLIEIRLPGAKASRQAILSAHGKLLSGSRSEFDAWIAQIQLRCETIFQALEEITPLPRLHDNGLTVEAMALLYDLRFAAGQILSELDEAQEKDIRDQQNLEQAKLSEWRRDT